MARNDACAGTGTTARPDPLLLPESAFDELATGGGSPAVIGRLWDGEWSRRLVLLLAFYEAAADPNAFGPLGFGSLGKVTDAWQALERAQEAAPDAVAAILMHPQVGGWLAYSLRRHRGGTSSTAPLHIDFGQLNTLALVAAAAAGHPLTTRVPLRDGRVLLPRLGMAHFAGCPPWDVAEAGTEDGRIWFQHGDRRIDVPSTAGTDADGWWALRQLRVETDGVPLVVWLDDLDPIRDLADPVPPARLTEAGARRWAELVADAWAMLVIHHRPVAEALAAGVTSLVPLPAGGGWDTRSASSGDAFGAIMCSPPPDAVTLAVSLAHEFMHIKLGGLMHLVPLTDSPGEPVLYAPWRDDPRPLAGFLQGVYAFSGIAAFWRRQRLVSAEPIDDFEYAYARSQTIEALENAKRADGLTAYGRRFVELLSDEVTGWSGDVVDAEAARLARLVADGHRAGWRVRNRRPEPADVGALVAAWTAKSSEPVHIGPSAVLPDPEMRHWSQARLGLARRRIVAPDRYAEARGERWAGALSDADLALFAGDPLAAAKGLVDQVIEDPASADAWSGLVLALAATGPHPANSVLAERPEVVQAVYRALPGRDISPVELAAWVGLVTGA
jgi:HEXXH motif-containing protein